MTTIKIRFELKKDGYTYFDSPSGQRLFGGDYFVDFLSQFLKEKLPGNEITLDNRGGDSVIVTSGAHQYGEIDSMYYSDFKSIPNMLDSLRSELEKIVLWYKSLPTETLEVEF